MITFISLDGTRIIGKFKTTAEDIVLPKNYIVISEELYNKIILPSKVIVNGIGEIADVSNTPTESPQEPPKSLTLEEQLTQLKNQLMTADEKYQALDKTTASLEGLKVAKIEQLNYFCEQDILSGFTSILNGHTYRTDDRDQTNFIGQYNQLMTDTTITTVLWKTRDVGYIEHTREEWLSIYNEAFEVIKQKLFKYEQLKQVVNTKTNNADVDIIVW